MLLETEAQLEERLSRPSPADIDALANLEGDLLVLGAGGKIGPKPLQPAPRAARAAQTQKRIIHVARFSDKYLPARLESRNIESTSCHLSAPRALSRLR